MASVTRLARVAFVAGLTSWIATLAMPASPACWMPSLLASRNTVPAMAPAVSPKFCCVSPPAGTLTLSVFGVLEPKPAGWVWTMR